MKIIFWNIGKALTPIKISLIDEAIQKECPDIFCIAEGSTSKINCESIHKVFVNYNYSCYYSPLFSEDISLKLNYKYISNGLKVFVKNTMIPSEKFAFPLQRKDGRIVALKTFINFRHTLLVFLHNKSKSGNREVTDDQKEFIFSLNDMLSKSEITKDTERTILIGDFNLEPWENILRYKGHLETSFFQSHNKINRKMSNKEGLYFNPLAESIFSTKIENLGGTYFNDNLGWALFDYVLYDTQKTELKYDIITSFKDGSLLLNSDVEIDGAFLFNELDHLPILTQIRN